MPAARIAAGAGELDLSKNAQTETLFAGYVFYHAARILFRCLLDRRAGRHRPFRRPSKQRCNPHTFSQLCNPLKRMKSATLLEMRDARVSKKKPGGCVSLRAPDLPAPVTGTSGYPSGEDPLFTYILPPPWLFMQRRGQNRGTSANGLFRGTNGHRPMNARTSSSCSIAAWRPWIYRSSSFAASCSTCPTSTGLPGASTSARPSSS